ncbi:MAG: AsmA family protein, partial [Thermodesulfobacteriota bacterium]
MLRYGKKISLVMGCMAGVVLILIFSIILFLQTNTFQKILLSTVNKNIPGQVYMENLDLDIFPGQIHAHGIKIESSNKKKLGSIDRLTIDLSWHKLLKKELNISLIEINSPGFDLDMSEKGDIDLVSAFILPDHESEKKSEKERDSYLFPLNITIDNFVINNAVIDFKKRDQDLEIALSGVDSVITEFDFFKQSAKIRSRISHGLIKHKKKSITMSTFQAQTGVSKRYISDLLIKTNVNGFNIELSADGSVGNPDAELKVTYGPGKIQSQSIDNILLECSLQDRVLAILPSNLKSGLGQLFLDGKIDFTKAFPHGFLDAEKNLEQISYKLNIRQDHNDLSRVPFLENNLKGRIFSFISCQGEGIDPRSVKADITADIRAEQLISKQMMSPLDIHIETSAVIDGAAAKIKEFKVDTSGVVLTGNADFHMPGFDMSAIGISGQFNLETDDPLLFEKLTGMPARGEVELLAKMDGALLAPEIEVDAKVYGLAVNDINIGDLELKADLDRTGRVNIENLILKLKESIFKVHGLVDLYGPEFDPDLGTAPNIQKSP